MAREASGHVQWRGGEWQTRIQDPVTKKREWVVVEAGLKENEEKLARALAQRMQERFAGKGYVPIERELTVREFFKRWCDWRRVKFPNQVHTDEQAFRLWIDDQLGARPIHAVSSDVLRSFSGWLDERAAKGDDFGPKRARNIFSVVAAMFRDATEAKVDKIRILSVNPCAGVAWPDVAESDPLHQLLYPNEFLALVSCPDVPVVRARLYALTLYTMTRIGEVRVFECKDFDLEHRLVKIVKAHDNGKGKRGQTKLTKSNKSRMCTIEDNLAPLVLDMVAETKSGRLFPDRPEGMKPGNQHAPQPLNWIPGTSKVCEKFRRDLFTALAWAGIKVRPELVDDSRLEESQPIRFHDLRATGITWRHARGDNATAIRQECGHEDVRTNDIYTRALAKLPAGELFPALPERLFSNGPNSDQRTKKSIKKSDKSCRRRESKTFPSGAQVHVIHGQSSIAPSVKGPNGPGSSQGSADPLSALSSTIQAAATAGEWEVVKRLAKKLEALKLKPEARV
jgi:integrase